MNAAVLLLQEQLDQAGLYDHAWETEHRFHHKRKWRFDLAHLDRKIAVEVHGGIHIGGRHTRGQEFQNDREKMNAGQLLGWLVLEVTTEHVMKTGYALDVISTAYHARGVSPP